MLKSTHWLFPTIIINIIHELVWPFASIQIEHEESQKQREMENDLEEQSRMIAASVEAEPTDDATLKLATDDKQSDDASEVTAS